MSAVEPPVTVAQPDTPTQRATAASTALALAAEQLRDDAQVRRRDRLLVDVLTVDLLAFADWLDRRAWLLSFAAGDVVGFDQVDLDADDELLALDGCPPAFVLGEHRV